MENQINIPKTVFDKEYSTQWKREVKFLEDKGIAYTYAKKHYRYPVIKFKYTKTPELFLALAEFYNQVRNETFFKDVEDTTKVVNAKLPIEDGFIPLDKNDLSEQEKKTVDFQINEEDVKELFTE